MEEPRKAPGPHPNRAAESGACHTCRYREESIGTAPNCEDTGKLLGVQGGGKEIVRMRRFPTP